MLDFFWSNIFVHLLRDTLSLPFHRQSALIDWFQELISVIRLKT